MLPKGYYLHMSKKRVVVIGGGTGLFPVLSGLKNHFESPTAIITMADDGGSAGILRDGVRSEIIEVLPEALDTEYWKPMKKNELTEFLKLISVNEPDLNIHPKLDLRKVRASKTPIIFTTGGNATIKGAQEVIKALAQVDRSIPWLYLIKTWPSISSFKASLEELEIAQRLGVADRIRYITGEFDREFIRGLMTLCDIYAAPSREEGFGLPLVEAQLCGKPVVSIAATATQETVVPDVTGFLAKAEPHGDLVRANVDDLAIYFRRLLTDNELRKRMGAQAQKHAKRFSPKHIAGQLLQLVEGH